MTSRSVTLTTLNTDISKSDTAADFRCSCVLGTALGLFVIVSVVLFRCRKRRHGRRTLLQQYTAVALYVAKGKGVPDLSLGHDAGTSYTLGNPSVPETARVAAGERAVHIPEAPEYNTSV